jgi:hypothetical protein
MYEKTTDILDELRTESALTELLDCRNTDLSR